MKNKKLKDFLVSFLIILAMVIVIFNFIGVSEGANNKNVVNNDSISKNLSVKSITISNSTEGGIKRAVEKSKSGTTVYLFKGVYSFNNTNININKNIKIVGKGSAKSIVIDARYEGNIFKIAKKGNLTLVNVTLLNAYSTNGGAIYNTGILSIKNSIFNNNIYDEVNNIGYSYYVNNKGGGAIYNAGKANIKLSVFINNRIWCGSGGAIYNNGNINIKSSSFLDNYAEGDGGAIENTGKITIKKSTFKKNIAGNFGGALDNGGKANIINSTFKNNSGDVGIAIANWGDLLLCKSKFRNNIFNRDSSFHN